MGVWVQNDILEMDNGVRFSSGMRENTLRGVVVMNDEHQVPMPLEVSSWDPGLHGLLRSAHVFTRLAYSTAHVLPLFKQLSGRKKYVHNGVIISKS